MIQNSRSRTAARTQTVARNAAQDSLVGAALGLLLVSGLIASSLDTRQMMVEAQSPLASLSAIVIVVVAQAALAATLCGAAIRKFAAND